MKAVHVGGYGDRIAVADEVTVALVIRDHTNNIGSFAGQLR